MHWLKKAGSKKMRRAIIRNWILLLILGALFIIIVMHPSWWEAALKFLFPDEKSVIYPRLSMAAMLTQHLNLVLISSSITIIAGVPLGILLTRPSMKDFLNLSSNLLSVGQTIPPVAVLALAVPVFGFGSVPTILALFLYGLLPVVRNTIAGIKAVPYHILDASYGIGMSRLQALFKIELPLAVKVIIAGIRISVIINIGTAMIGAVIGAGGLGVPVVAGLVQDNIAFVIQGVLPAAALALFADQVFNNIEKSLQQS
jgi:osmoprotectant transport system permease protein